MLFWFTIVDITVNSRPLLACCLNFGTGGGLAITAHLRASRALWFDTYLCISLVAHGTKLSIHGWKYSAAKVVIVLPSHLRSGILFISYKYSYLLYKLATQMLYHVYGWMMFSSELPSVSRFVQKLVENFRQGHICISIHISLISIWWDPTDT